eukprot:CAMPEP_0204278004 /NCGR_PEP_ID=MMETSP0468-20130131/29626_1 /ASSEMBLY_ACC=CAM_ASM_000383 /TAXON_ID=2969 /ORGANISM="Oxyrrhis marina" /LENGTH=128 /DNA_ID=CAMNT_0051254863 /DNA_START=79 /DNA_END=465 /DNA_ORIENTATION=+
MIAVRGTFLDLKDEQEAHRRAESADRWMESGRRDFVALDLDLRKELLTVGEKRAEPKLIDARNAPPRTEYRCVHNKQVCSFCRDWLMRETTTACKGHPEEKCGKSSCCVSHHNYRLSRPTVKKRSRKR